MIPSILMLVSRILICNWYDTRCANTGGHTLIINDNRYYNVVFVCYLFLIWRSHGRVTCHVKYSYEPILIPNIYTSSSDDSIKNINILASVSPITSTWYWLKDMCMIHGCSCINYIYYVTYRTNIPNTVPNVTITGTKRNSQIQIHSPEQRP